MSQQAEQPSFDPFRILSSAERQQHLDAYQEYLERRNGEIDLESRSLPRREAYFREIEEKPVAWGGETDYEGFHDHLSGSGTRTTDERTLWLATAAKVNLIESYGVSVELAALFERPHRLRAADPIYLYQMFEERYHTRILTELCSTYGLDQGSQPLGWMKRWLVNLMIYLPERIRWISILTGEALGSTLFKVLAESTHHFSEDPEVEARVRSLITEIWADEVLHAAYLRAKVGRVGIAIARFLVPLVGWVMMKDLPPLEGGGLHRKVLERLRQGIEIPPCADWMQSD